MSRDYDLMLRCRDGHFIADVRRAPGGFADGFCKGCNDWRLLDWPGQMIRVRRALRRVEEREES